MGFGAPAAYQSTYQSTSLANPVDTSQAVVDDAFCGLDGFIGTILCVRS
jgi:hypothetical protein